jgi:hypothetical protein
MEILEKIITFISSYPVTEFIDFEGLISLKNTLQETLFSVFAFLEEQWSNYLDTGSEGLLDNVLVALASKLALLWIEEETEVPQEQLDAVTPLLEKVALYV